MDAKLDAVVEYNCWCVDNDTLNLSSEKYAGSNFLCGVKKNLLIICPVDEPVPIYISSPSYESIDYWDLRVSRSIVLE